MLTYFGDLGLRKLGERVATEFERVGDVPQEDFEQKLMVWAND